MTYRALLKALGTYCVAFHRHRWVTVKRRDGETVRVCERCRLEYGK